MSYSYDYLSRLSTATFHNYSDAGVISGTNNYNENLTYDLRGNIQTLQRTGFYTNGSTCTYGQIDNLTYSYTANTNRLHKVLDGTVTAGDAKSRGFNGNLSTVDNSMTYDRNGNLNKNLHKNVSTITYNHLNLPTVITFTSGNTIEFLYDASGMKLRKTVKVGATVQYIQDYLPGGIEYRQTGTGVKRVESVFHAEGRYYNTNVDASNTLAWRKEYNFKDHLGNTRLVFTDRNANGVVDITGTASTSDVLQENHYYSFGLAFEGAWLQNDATAPDNKYQYNGKELNDDFGLNWNDYGARWYDASVGRWNGVDPLAEVYFSKTTYCYAINNPLSYIDPDGRNAVLTVDKEKKHVDVTTTFYWSTQSAEVLGGKPGFEEATNSRAFLDLITNLWALASEETRTVDVDGENYTVSFTIKFEEKTTHEDAAKSFTSDEGSNMLFATKGKEESKYSTRGFIKVAEDQIRKDAQTFSHEVGHAMGLDHPNTEATKYYQENGIYSIMNGKHAQPRGVLKKDIKGVVSEAIKLANSNLLSGNVVRVVLVTSESGNSIHIKNADGTKMQKNYIPPK